MALSGDIKQNYVELQQSTGQRFSDMAARLTSPEVMRNLDANGRASNTELADWLSKQSDDEDAIERVANPAAWERKQSESRTSAPKERTTQQSKQQNS